MFKEIAVEPAAVATSYRDFSYITEKFGIAEGRLIAAFPSKWKRFVYQEAQARLKGTAELSRLEVRLRALADDTFLARGRPGEGCAENWLAAALAEHRREPFDGIITNAQVDGPFFVAAIDLDGEHPVMRPNRQWHIQREAVVMAACCGPLLARAQHVKLVDPHFDPGTTRFRRPLVEFVKLTRPGVRIDIFRGDNADAAYIEQKLREALAGALPPGAEVRVFMRPQDALHNRYVLTDAGGMYFLTGLDDQGQGGLTTDEVGLLEADVWSVQWSRYSGDDPIARWLG
ncbi:hypothetical protein [Paraburkholderia bryophila]|uniref:Uncharacterized protein n=1 Tax=Paraburkholderia bryophila TaxID=420952 RepID=A0A7Z0B841_9BURK|nr:hypothetical protein [Paraburkholderia bryophila]NYH23838.1 hypothetical protein [Paraburkholderia bryophila]